MCTDAVWTYQLLTVGRRLLLSYLWSRAVPLQHDQLAGQVQHDALCHAGLSWRQIKIKMRLFTLPQCERTPVQSRWELVASVTCCGAFNVMPVSVRTEVRVTETTRAG